MVKHLLRLLFHLEPKINHRLLHIIYTYWLGLVWFVWVGDQPNMKLNQPNYCGLTLSTNLTQDQLTSLESPWAYFFTRTPNESLWCWKFLTQIIRSSTWNLEKSDILLSSLNFNPISICKCLSRHEDLGLPYEGGIWRISCGGLWTAFEEFINLWTRILWIFLRKRTWILIEFSFAFPTIPTNGLRFGLGPSMLPKPKVDNPNPMPPYLTNEYRSH